MPDHAGIDSRTACRPHPRGNPTSPAASALFEKARERGHADKDARSVAGRPSLWKRARRAVSNGSNLHLKMHMLGKRLVLTGGSWFPCGFREMRCIGTILFGA